MIESMLDQLGQWRILALLLGVSYASGVFLSRREMWELFNGIDACSYTMRDSDHMPVNKNITT